jgi:ADP-heptose:LPS heptosyltransferase
MKDSKRLRFLDRFIGSTICRLFSVLNKIKIKKQPEPIKNILLMELFEMGAATMIYPSVVYIKSKIKNANIYVLTLKSMKQSWELLDMVPRENIYVLDDSNMFSFYASILSAMVELRRKNIDLVIDYELFMRIPAILSFLIKSKLRAGFDRYEFEGLYRGDYYDTKCMFNQNYHVAKNFLALTKAAVTQTKEYPVFKAAIDSSEIVCPKYKSDKKTNDEIKKKLKGAYSGYSGQKIILVNPDVGSNLSLRNYPKENYVHILKKLLHDYPHHLIVLMGVKDNIPVCAYIKQKLNSERCIDFCAKTATLKELFELLTLSDILVTNDSGPSHFAAATGTKTVVLFGPETPFMYGPIGKAVSVYSNYHCSPCLSAFNHKLSKCKNNLCLKTINPDHVYDIIKKTMEDKAEYQTINVKMKYL